MTSKLQKTLKNPRLRLDEVESLKDINQDLKTEYELKYDIDRLANEFLDQD